MKKYPVTEMHWVVTRLLIDLMKLGMEEDCSQNKGYRRATDNMAIEKKKKVWVIRIRIQILSVRRLHMRI